MRLLLIVAASVLGGGLLAVLAALYLLLQPDRFTAMLKEQAVDAGLQLTLSSPASPTLFPRPALHLEGITLIARSVGTGNTANYPILQAANGRLVLPWRTVFGGPMVISRMQINSPRVDLDALQAWLMSLPPQSAAMPGQIPRIVTGVRIRNGSVMENNNEWLSDVSLDTGRLMSGQAFSIHLSGKEPRGRPLQLELSIVPSIANSVLMLDDITVHATDSSATALHLAGRARWKGATDISLQLHGKYSEANESNYDAAVLLTPAGQNNPLLLHISLLGKDNHIDLELSPLALAQWWNQLANPQGPQISTPPGNGQVDMATFDIGRVHIEGLSIQTGNAVPASASTVAASAKTAAPHP
ncbi:membrane assembly protein AsmA [Dyella sp. M7H15-1]|nr:membrane assembly protein AsmA [Dyella sp. M7H15-1]